MIKAHFLYKNKQIYKNKILMNFENNNSMINFFYKNYC